MCPEISNARHGEEGERVQINLGLVCGSVGHDAKKAGGGEATRTKPLPIARPISMESIPYLFAIGIPTGAMSRPASPSRM
jgi:hypothetical protein